ncbi:hypothetical protein GCM10023096_52000 [Nonomuraea ferruginea]
MNDLRITRLRTTASACAGDPEGRKRGSPRRLRQAVPLRATLMAKTAKPSPPKSVKAKANRAKRRHLLSLRREAVRKEKAERSERHAGIRQEPRAGRPRTRRASRR